MPSETVRLFLALELPRATLDTLTSLQKRIQVGDTARAIRWNTIQSIHLTLKFFGETSADRQEEIIKALHVANDGHAPFELTIQGAGCFPNFNHPRVTWAGCGGNLTALRTLRDAIEQMIT